ncbi:hypothetical protein EM89_011710 [Vibrio parahaemolyticus]|nr:hypothetical protein FORC71_4003 [Vibrio parahaemolyticus]OQT01444.1 hypothetical protein EN04_006030 [Vibrio parahaemolyticus O4:K12 str. K1203]OQS66513.1 hypothetical protein EM68_005145 [Vibrio parahaemolyticus]OQS75986.1 hypothetical protein EM54_004870 [Vibrio parahaemolyticus]OQS79908.1 hypothetical protein EM89_011710 [Vibrio parahaemolyticus]
MFIALFEQSGDVRSVSLEGEMVISEKSVNGTLVKSALNGAWVYTKNYLSGERHVCFSNGNQPLI